MGRSKLCVITAMCTIQQGERGRCVPQAPDTVTHGLYRLPRANGGVLHTDTRTHCTLPLLLETSAFYALEFPSELLTTDS